MKKIEIYADGSCLNNPGVGGWAAVLIYNERIKEISGAHEYTTNNRMELTAVIEALKCLKYPCEVTITTDSRYVVDSINKNWLSSWQKRGWKKADGKPVLNDDLWKELLTQLNCHKITFQWIKGHAGHKFNERCDFLAVNEASKFSKVIIS